MSRWRNMDPDKLAKVGKFRSPKKTSQSADLAAEYELAEEEWPEFTEQNKGAFGARVVEVHKRYAFVSREDERGAVDTKDVWLATIARRYLQADRAERNLVAVGDRVLVVPATEPVKDAEGDLPQCVIEHLSPRHSSIRRLDPHTPDRHHVLAANPDQILIVASYKKPKVKWGLIDRYLVLAEAERMHAIIVINKRDLLESEKKAAAKAEAEEHIATYRELGYDVLVTQANSDDADEDPETEKLRELMQGKTTLLSGHSGVGKSSLVNLLDPEIVQAVEPDEDIFYKGRHTTTFASFIKLGTGGFAIDTPGIRSFTFEDKSAIELTDCFVELRPLLGRCKFRECRHVDEPECVVREKVADGSIKEWRYRSYLAIWMGASGREGRVRDLPE